MREVEFDDGIRFNVYAALYPGLMRALQFLVEAEALFPQEICNVFVSPIV